MPRPASWPRVAALLLMFPVIFGGSVVLQAQAPAEPAPQEAEPMTNDRLGRLLQQHFADREVAGRPGLWRVDLSEAKPAAKVEVDPDAIAPDANGQPAEPPLDDNDPDEGGDPDEDADLGPGAGERLPAVLLVMTDAGANRMRIMMPIRRFDPDRVEDLQLALIALHANYDRALDARYAVHEGVLWSAFIHPLGSLTAGDLRNALEQVQTLRENTGTSYSSGGLLFGGGQQPPPDEPDDNVI